MENKKIKVKILKDGPYAVSGGLPLAKEVIISDENGDSVGYERKDAIECANNYALCRCGSSKTKPFCDGSHIDEKFNDGDPSLK